MSYVTNSKRSYRLVPQSAANNSCVSLSTIEAKKRTETQKQRTLSRFITIPLYYDLENDSEALKLTNYNNNLRTAVLE